MVRERFKSKTKNILQENIASSFFVSVSAPTDAQRLSEFASTREPFFAIELRSENAFAQHFHVCFFCPRYLNLSNETRYGFKNARKSRRNMKSWKNDRPNRRTLIAFAFTFVDWPMGTDVRTNGTKIGTDCREEGSRSKNTFFFLTIRYFGF